MITYCKNLRIHDYTMLINKQIMEEEGKPSL